MKLGTLVHHVLWLQKRCLGTWLWSFKVEKNRVKSSPNFERFITKSLRKKWKKTEAPLCRSALLLSFCENRFCLSQLIKKLNSTKRGTLFRHLCVSKVITTAHAHKSGVIFHIFPRAFKQNKKNKALRPKMTKIASRGGGGVLPLGSAVSHHKNHHHDQEFKAVFF